MSGNDSTMDLESPTQSPATMATTNVREAMSNATNAAGIVSEATSQAGISKKQEQERYLEEMDAEIKGWAEIAMQRKKALRLAKREKESKPTVITYESIEKNLSEDWKQFLAERPDYQSLLLLAKDVRAAVDIADEETREAKLRVAHTIQRVQNILTSVSHVIVHRPDPIIDGI